MLLDVKTLQDLVMLLFLSSVVAMVVHKRDLPYTVVLVVLGLGMGLLHVKEALNFTPELVLLVFLPALLFEAAWNAHLDELKRTAVPVTVLAVVGVVIAMAVVGGALTLTGALPMGFAFLVGAMIAATDPVSVLATFKALGLSTRLTTLVEAESLFNDGTAVVVFKIVAATVLAGKAFDLAFAVGDFAYTVLVGIAIGVAVGALITRMVIIIDSHLVEITLTTVAAYGTYLLAEHFHASGIIAVVIAGLVIGRYARAGMSENTVVAVGYFWEYAAFLANSVLFVLIGARVNPGELWPMIGTVAITIVAALAGRVLSVYPLVALTNRFSEPVSFMWQHILVWGGLRGALSMALVLSLPDGTPYRQVLINLVFGVVLFSLLVQGITIGPWLQRLKKDPRHALAGGPECVEEGPASPLVH